MAKVIVSVAHGSSFVVDSDKINTLFEIFSTAEKYESTYTPVGSKPIVFVTPVGVAENLLNVSPMTPLQYQMAKIAGEKHEEKSDT